MMKKTFGVLRKNWPTMGIGQKIGWIITFPVMFPLLMFVTSMDQKYGNEYKKKHGKRWDK